MIVTTNHSYRVNQLFDRMRENRKSGSISGGWKQGLG
jgi:hypothetical protein